MGLVLGQSLMVISITGILLYAKVSPFITSVGSGVAPGARAPPCWIVLESFHKRETCFAGGIFRAWSGGPNLAEPPCGTEKAWFREATADLAEKLSVIWDYVVMNAVVGMYY